MNLENAGKKKTVRICRKDLLDLLEENAQLKASEVALQEQIVMLKSQLDTVLNINASRTIPPPPESYESSFDPYDPNVYIDGAYRP